MEENSSLLNQSIQASIKQTLLSQYRKSPYSQWEDYLSKENNNNNIIEKLLENKSQDYLLGFNDALNLIKEMNK